MSLRRRLGLLSLVALLAGCQGDGALEGTISVKMRMEPEAPGGPMSFTPETRFHVTATGQDLVLDIPHDAELVGIDLDALEMGRGVAGKRYRIVGDVDGKRLKVRRLAVVTE